ncbi:MAG: serine/threonine protein kinase [Phycisphaerae bacterium]|nr:serine/threonine protein kinase [Phycisphaerae bacterium]
MATYTFKHGDRPLEGLTVQRAVGRGGFGEVYYAISDAGKQLAIKYLRDNPDIELRGINIVMNLKSPHLITVYDVRRNDEGEPFVIMEYVSGPSLRDVMLAEPNGMPPEKAVFFINGIAKGLSYLHERGIVHRDLKPGNIFYDDGYVLIGDYGLSKHISVSRHSGQTVSVGTVHYMAPEIGSGNYSKAIDIYSLGVILYEMLTGRLPFTGSSMAEVLMRHLNDTPDTSLLPPGFGPVVAKALAKDPNERYADVNEMVDALMALTDIGDRVSAFDPTSLSAVPRDERAAEVPTRTSPPPIPPLPNLDAREAARQGWEQRVRDIGGRIANTAEVIGEQIRAGTGRAVAARAEQKAARRAERERRRRDPVTGELRSSRFSQIVVLLVVAIGVSVATTLLMDVKRDPEAFIFGMIFAMLGAVLGTMLAHFRILKRVPTHHWLFDRIVMAGTAGICMVPAFGMVADMRNDQAVGAVAALCATILICDWSKRIRSGQRGRVNGGDAIVPAIIGLATAGALFHAEDFSFAAAAICATTSMLTQAAAAMWPERDPRKSPVPYYGVPGPPKPPIDPPAHRVNAGDAQVVLTAPPPAPPAPVQPDDAATPAAPSFAGRRGGGFLGFVAKLLMVIGLCGAITHPAVTQNALDGWGPFPARMLRDTIGEMAPALFPIMLGLGCLFLIISRRRHSGVHMLRALMGGAAAFSAAIMALGPARTAVGVLFATGDLAALRDPNAYGPLMLAAGLLATAVLLLFWPDTDRDRVVV